MVEVILFVAGAIAVVVGAVKLLPEAGKFVWAAYRLPLHMAEMVEQLRGLDDVKAAAEKATNASTIAAEKSEVASAEWQGATAAVREMADGHNRRLNDHDDRLSELERWRALVEGS